MQFTGTKKSTGKQSYCDLLLQTQYELQHIIPMTRAH